MAYQTIKIKKYEDILREHQAVAAIIPGSVIELASTNKVQKCATAGGKWAGMVAVEDALQGKGINDAYAANDQVQVWVTQRGEVAYLLVEDEENIVIGDFVEVATGGRIRKFTSATVAIGIALEAKNLSSLPEGSESSAGGDYYNPRIKVQLI
jgi:hypothetical protein